MGRTYDIGSVVFNSWVIVDVIGEGSFGKVFEIQRKDDFTTERSALKVITVPRNQSELRSLIEGGQTQEQAKRYLYGIVEGIVGEIKIMSKLKATANIVSYEDHEIIPHADGMGWDILIRMELLHPLLTYAYEHPFSRRDIIQIGIDMCRALELCQKYNIIHRDIKPENIFVSNNGDYKLGDFGIARTIERSDSDMTKTGTYNYMAPEVFRGEDYGFSVDIYSLGIVLYRLINKNRTPFLPPSPQEIRPEDQTEAQVRRMRGDPIPAPFYSEGRLPEIVLKACAPLPADRYSSPMQMRQELEAILYDASDAAQIYPDGDTLEIMRNYYATLGSKKAKPPVQEDSTASAFGKRRPSGGAAAEEDEDERTTGAFRRRPDQAAVQGDETVGAFRWGPAPPRPAQVRRQPATTAKAGPKQWIVAGVAAFLVVAVGAGGLFLYSRHQKELTAEKQAKYQQLMTDGTALTETDPSAAAAKFLEAQGLYPEQTAPYISYAYALYCGRDYETCVSYIEDELAMGKDYPVEEQNRLTEILGAAYFEMDDYAAAASFFRLTTAGGDITVSAMRDYAVSLGRLGDVDAAGEVLERMVDAGAQDDVTAYVQAEVDYAQEDYVSAESGFQSVLDTTEDPVLQKRALRSLAEVYRDCCALARSGQSPIYTPATREVEVLSDGIERFGLRSDSTLWEMLGMAYFESYHTDETVPPEYLSRAAECFNRVIELGVQKDYLYRNLYTVYYELQRYDDAEKALQDYEQVFPNDYMPYALRGMMLITIENQKPEYDRDFTAAQQAYERAGELLHSGDDATYYQQLESLMEQLRAAGYID